MSSEDMPDFGSSAPWQFQFAGLDHLPMLVPTRRKVVSEINFFISLKNELYIRKSKKTQAWMEDGISVLQLSFKLHPHLKEDT